MRTLVHLSDLHFGRVDPDLPLPLIRTIAEIRPDLVVVSGDLTQRAKSAEFIAARRFLDAIKFPRVVVPGNHDVPLWNFAARVLMPFTRYRRHITDDLAPVFVDDEIAVLGINTARSMVIKNGRINHEQIAAVREKLSGVPNDVTKIIVTHHPFDVPDGRDDDDLVGRAEHAMKMFADCGADLLLAGHFHTSHAETTAARYRIVGHAALVIQAGTATSTRGRGETNSFNVIRIAHPRVELQRYGWDVTTGCFVPGPVDTFEARGREWLRAAER